MNKRNRVLIGASLGLLVGVPGAALALQGPDDPPRQAMGEPRTRADLQARLQERFARMDANHDGVVTQDEIRAAHEAMRTRFEQHRAERQRAAFERLDADHDGKLSFAEFSAGREHGPPGPDGHDGGPEREHGQRMGWDHAGRRGPHGDMMARADANHDGRVTLQEYSAGPLAMFDRADTNHDGTISPDEMRAAHQAMGDDAPPPPPGE